MRKIQLCEMLTGHKSRKKGVKLRWKIIYISEIWNFLQCCWTIEDKDSLHSISIAASGRCGEQAYFKRALFCSPRAQLNGETESDWKPNNCNSGKWNEEGKCKRQEGETKFVYSFWNCWEYHGIARGHICGKDGEIFRDLRNFPQLVLHFRELPQLFSDITTLVLQLVLHTAATECSAN